MSKKNQNVEATAIATELTEAQVSQTKTYPYAIDGTQATKAIEEHGGVSKAIRALTAKEFSRGEVAKMLNKRYQHVRNVLITPIKKA
jgi:hypothetical protein